MATASMLLRFAPRALFMIIFPKTAKNPDPATPMSTSELTCGIGYYWV
jgi:hypothetical protein